MPPFYNWRKLWKCLEGQFVCDIPAVTCNKSWCEILFKQIIRYESNDGSFKFNKQDDVIFEKSKIKLKRSVPGIKCLGFLYITVCPHDIERSIVCQAWNWMHPRQSFSCVSCLGWHNFFLQNTKKMLVEDKTFWHFERSNTVGGNTFIGAQSISVFAPQTPFLIREPRTEFFFAIYYAFVSTWLCLLCLCLLVSVRESITLDI